MLCYAVMLCAVGAGALCAEQAAPSHGTLINMTYFGPLGSQPNSHMDTSITAIASYNGQAQPSRYAEFRTMI